MFIGDVMGHDAQIIAAYDSVTHQFNYDQTFEPVTPLLRSADFAIANLEVTLAGKPYGGYPKFSSPDELAASLKRAGIDALMLANNHSADRGNQGIIRTIEALDSLKIEHTGTFKNLKDRNKRNALVLEKNDVKIGVLNYTYGLNGMPVSVPVIVNRIDSLQMKRDILETRKLGLDKLIVFLHWGKEYLHQPSQNQQDLANYLFSLGVDIIIGSHPHVLQPMAYMKDKGQFIAYSLGNFVSNQRPFPRDGGAIVELTLRKENGDTKIIDSGYHLVWVDKTYPISQGKFQILSCTETEKQQFNGLSESSRNKMKEFMDSSRMLLQEKNLLVKEKEH